MNTDFFSKGHKDVTWVLVKVFLHGSRLAKDPNAALIRQYKFSVTGAISNHRIVYILIIFNL